VQVEGAWKWALALHALAWYMQIHPGHAIFERKKPALLDSLVQAFAAAPLFVWLEVLFAFGYRSELQKRVSHKVKSNKP
jgi:2-hydroxy fatty acid dioxygenase